jgi:DNA-binding NtrC family response regulator
MNKIRVLVVDDEPQIRKLLNIALQSADMIS